MKTIFRAFVTMAFLLVPSVLLANSAPVVTHMENAILEKYSESHLTEADVIKINELKNFEITGNMSAEEAYQEIFGALKDLKKLSKKLHVEEGTIILYVDNIPDKVLCELEAVIKAEGKVKAKYGTFYLATNAPIGYEEETIYSIPDDEWKELSNDYGLPKTKEDYMKKAQKLNCLFLSLPE